MSNFKEMFNSLVMDAQVEMAREEMYSQGAEKMFENLDSLELATNRLAMENKADRYTEREVNGRIVRDYHHSTAPANRKELWKADMVEKTTTSTKSRAVLREIKSLPKNYLDSVTCKKSTTTYDIDTIYTNAGEEMRSSYITMYSIVNYRIYRQAIILDILPVDSSKTYHSYDEVINLRNTDYVDSSRDKEESNQLLTHLVFKYQPINKSGKPNKYCGLAQLKTWLHSLDCVSRRSPATLKDALECIKGETLSIPFARAYDYTTRSDDFTVYTIFGDIDSLEDEFREKETVNYQCISDYELNDVSSDDESYNESLDNVQCGLGNTNFYPIIIKYECHNEFRTQLPLAYSHIGYIFD